SVLQNETVSGAVGAFYGVAIGPVHGREQRILAPARLIAPPHILRRDAHGLARDVAGRAAAPVGPEALKERVAGVDASVDVVSGDDPGAIRERLEMERRRRARARVSASYG